jgi:phosphoribosylanthranilate isomerase
MKLKICGLTRLADIKMVNEALPDYAGFVFAKSRRQVDETMADLLKKYLNPEIKTVGVFVNENLERIVRLCQRGTIDLVQLHGDEDKDYMGALKKRVPNQIIKAVRVQTARQIAQAERLPCDYLLLDTDAKGQFGGSGVAFDWSIIPIMQKPYFLAGGLNMDNIGRAVSQCSPYCLDVSSGVETDGIKDSGKILTITQFVRSVK